MDHTDKILTPEIGIRKFDDIFKLREEHLTQAGIPVISATDIMKRISPPVPTAAVFTPDITLFNLAVKSYDRGFS